METSISLHMIFAQSCLFFDIIKPQLIERSLGKLRFLKEWHFLCGQQLMVKF